MEHRCVRAHTHHTRAHMPRVHARTHAHTHVTVHTCPPHTPTRVRASFTPSSEPRCAHGNTMRAGSRQGSQDEGTAGPGPWRQRGAASVQSQRPLPLSLHWPGGHIRPRQGPVRIALGAALVTTTLLLLPPCLLVPQGDVPGGSRACHPQQACTARAEPPGPRRLSDPPRDTVQPLLWGPGAHRRKKRQTVQVNTSTEPSVQHWAM